MAKSTGRRIGMFVAAASMTAAGVVGTSSAAGAAPGDIPPQGCGLVSHEIGPLSSLIHRLEPALMPLKLAYPVHDLNCGLVITLERLTGLQQRPNPGGPFG